jgi:hypothetical protein
MNSGASPRSVGVVLALSLIACDPRRAVGPNEPRLPMPQPAVVGRIIHADLGTPVFDGTVEMLGIGRSTSDTDGMYAIGTKAQTLGLSELVVRVEAQGFVPMYRVVPLAASNSEFPVIELTPLGPPVSVAPTGGKYVSEGGVVVLADSGTVSSTTSVAVTLLRPSTLGRLRQDSDASVRTALYVEPEKPLHKPLRLQIPIEESARLGTTFTVYRFVPDARRWVVQGNAAVSAMGTYIETEVISGDLYALQQDEPNWAARNTKPDWVFYNRGSWQLVGQCIGEGPVMSGVFNYNRLFWTSVSQQQFPDFYTHLETIYAGPVTEQSSQIHTVPAGEEHTVWKRVVMENRTRYGEVWYKADPDNKVAYEYFYVKFFDWETDSEACPPDDDDPQGIIA